MVDWSVYEDILREMILPELNSQKTIKEYQEAVRVIRESYDTSSKVKVDYNIPINQKAYFLAYFPAYAFQMYDILAKIPRSYLNFLIEGEEIRATFVGVGPGSEFYGFYSFMKKHTRLNRPKVRIKFVERENRWVSFINTQISKLNTFFDFSGAVIYSCDFSYCAKCLTQCKAFMSSPSIVFFQNFLNEDTLEDSGFIKGVGKIIQKVGSNSLLVFSETKYSNNRRLLQDLMKTLSSNYSGLEVISENLNYSREVRLPYEYRQEVLKVLDGSDRLIPRKNVKYYSLVLRKNG